MKKPANTEKENVDKDRRDFLKNSVYAAYATPLITALLVEEASAGDSCPPGLVEYCRANPDAIQCKKCR
jgi:hypothetical protein